jgi:hypothetical protein
MRTRRTRVELLFDIRRRSHWVRDNRRATESWGPGARAVASERLAK